MTKALVNPKDKIGATKAALHLVPPTAIAMVAQVLAVGAEKYGPYNWREFPINRTLYCAAALRHIYADMDGETIDPDPRSGLMHLAHAAAGLLILLDAIACDAMIDDRPPPGAAAAIMAGKNP
jgi:hypothetical protein